MANLPQNYQPSALRKPAKDYSSTPTAYCIGFDDADLGWTAGPFPSLEDALEEVPVHIGSFIYIIGRGAGGNGMRKLYSWNEEKMRWEFIGAPKSS
jgi:hypothetical protein